MQTQWIGEPDAINESLARWRGWRAQPVAYTVSHGILILSLFPANRTLRREAYIQCKDCQVVQLYRTSWDDADIGVTATKHRLGLVHTVTDPGRLHVVCYAVFVAEAEKPINFHKEWSVLS